MIYNDKELEISKVEAMYIIKKNKFDTYIKIMSSEGVSITFNYKINEFDPRLMEKNFNYNLIPHIFWDVDLITKDTYYLFDLTKDKVELTRLDDNLFKIKVHVENPDMIYCPLKDDVSFNNLFIETTFSFTYE